MRRERNRVRRPGAHLAAGSDQEDLGTAGRPDEDLLDQRVRFPEANGEVPEAPDRMAVAVHNRPLQQLGEIEKDPTFRRARGGIGYIDRHQEKCWRSERKTSTVFHNRLLGSMLVFADNPPVPPTTLLIRMGMPGDEEKPARPTTGLGIDLILACVLFALIAGIVTLAQRWKAPIREAVSIDLSPRALPGYTLLSLSRGFAAYLLSLLFTLVYGTIA